MNFEPSKTKRIALYALLAVVVIAFIVALQVSKENHQEQLKADVPSEFTRASLDEVGDAAKPNQAYWLGKGKVGGFELRSIAKSKDKAKSISYVDYGTVNGTGSASVYTLPTGTELSKSISRTIESCQKTKCSNGYSVVATPLGSALVKTVLNSDKTINTVEVRVVNKKNDLVLISEANVPTKELVSRIQTIE